MKPDPTTKDWNGAARHITFELSKNEAWSFPRAHLKRFEYIQNAARRYLQFSFPALTLQVESDIPEELFKNVLAGNISRLIQRAEEEQKSSDNPSQAKPLIDSVLPGTASTGLIRRDYEQ